MILWICPNGSMGLQIFVSAEVLLKNASASGGDLKENQ